MGITEPAPPIPTVEEQLLTLVDQVIAVNLKQMLPNAADPKLHAALRALDRVNVDSDQAAVGALDSFIRIVEAQRGTRISEADADSLIADAHAIIEMLLGG